MICGITRGCWVLNYECFVNRKRVDLCFSAIICHYDDFWTLKVTYRYVENPGMKKTLTFI